MKKIIGIIVVAIALSGCACKGDPLNHWPKCFEYSEHDGNQSSNCSCDYYGRKFDCKCQPKNSKNK